MIPDIAGITNPDSSTVEWLVAIFTDIGECHCVKNNNHLIDNGLEPVDCTEMEDIHAFEVSHGIGDHRTDAKVSFESCRASRDSSTT